MKGPQLLVLEGDGIGPEITPATCRVLEATSERYGLGLHFETAEIGFAALRAQGNTLPDEVIEAARAADGLILGPVSTFDYPPETEGGRNPSGTLRRSLDLYANIRPSRGWPGLERGIKGMDLVIVRENTEGFYADRNMAVGPGEFMPDPDMALSVRKITRAACRRIAEQAFAIAAGRPARHVTAVHKANVLKLTDGLFLEETRAAAARTPEVSYDEVIVDAMTAHLVRAPERWDTVVTTNMYGDILSDLAGEMAGGLGLAGSLNAGTDHAMAQAAHGSAPDIAGQDRANPSALIASAAMLLDWLGQRRSDEDFSRAAEAIRSSLGHALASPGSRTPDLGGRSGTKSMGEAVAIGTT